VSVTLFDAQTGCGGATPGVPEVVTVGDLLEEMRRMEIARSLVRITPETLDLDVSGSNDALFAACAGEPALTPCPIVVPASGGDFPPEAEQVAGLIAQGARAVWIRPEFDYWLLAPWHCGPLFSALERRRLPVICLRRLVRLPDLADLAARHPALPLLLAELDYREQRPYLPLLEQFPNVHVALGAPYSVHGGIEQLVARAGAGRLLFGSGFPAAEPMAAIAQLMYAEISAGDKQRIGAGNLEALVEGVVL
jgi:hypothetical protein